MSKRKQFITENGVIYANHDTVKIGGRTFEIVGCINTECLQQSINHCFTLPTLTECYSRASATKISIYEDWRTFLYNNSKTFGAIGVASYNSMTFTIDCIFVNEIGNFYAHITPAHNYLYVFGNEVK